MPNQNKPNIMSVIKQNFRKAWVLIFMYLRLGSTPVFGKADGKTTKLPRDVKGRNAALAASLTHSQGRLQRDDTLSIAEVETESLFLNTHALTTHMTWPRRGNGREMGSAFLLKSYLCMQYVSLSSLYYFSQRSKFSSRKLLCSSVFVSRKACSPLHAPLIERVQTPWGELGASQYMS